jgi:hypothetical protein
MWIKEFPLLGENIPSLEKATHVYRCSDGNVYKSVSSILSNIKPKFDLEQKALEYSLRRKMPIDDVFKLWEDKKNVGLKYGTDVHENVEEYFKTQKVLNPRYESIVKEIYDKVYAENGYNELICFDKNKKICGTADYVVLGSDFFDIFDFKTNIKFNFENQYENKFLLDPVSHLPNSEYFIYSLQLSFYANMIERLTGLKCRFLNIFWLKRMIDTKLVFKAKWLKYTVPYLKEEVGSILCNV